MFVRPKTEAGREWGIDERIPEELVASLHA
jgi:hypothetical protein